MVTGVCGKLGEWPRNETRSQVLRKDLSLDPILFPDSHPGQVLLGQGHLQVRVNHKVLNGNPIITMMTLNMIFVYNYDAMVIRMIKGTYTL